MSISSNILSVYGEDKGGSYVTSVNSVFHYKRMGVFEDEQRYILICDGEKKFSLINTRLQLPDILPIRSAYIRTDYKSSSFTSPVSYVKPSDVRWGGYILQSLIKTGNSTAYVVPCDLGKLVVDEETRISSLEVVPHMVWHGFFGQYGGYYPGNRNVVGDFLNPQMVNVGIQHLNNRAYTNKNYFGIDPDTRLVPVLSSYVNTNLIKRDTTISPIYLQAQFPRGSGKNSCTANNINIYPEGYIGWSSPMDGTTADGLSHQSYTLCYPIDLHGASGELLASLISDPVNFLSTNGEYARPLCRAFHVYGMESRYSFTFRWMTFIPGPFIGVLLTYTPASATFAWSNYAVPTDKNMLSSSGMYANTDMIFSDIMYISTSSLSAALRYQVMRSKRGSIILKYKPVNNFIYLDLQGPNAPPFQESDDLFYITNGLNPEEYVHCDGPLFGKQQFRYSTFTKHSSDPMLYGGAWEPGEQNVLLKGIKIIFDEGLKGTCYTSELNEYNIPEWKFTNITTNDLSHGIGYLNQVVHQLSSSAGLSQEDLDQRNYVSSCQSPYDVVFCDVEYDDKSLKLDNCLLLGMTSNQGFLDYIYDAIEVHVVDGLSNRTWQTGEQTIEYEIPVYSIILVTTNEDLLYSCAVSYEHLSTDPGISGWYITTLHGKNSSAKGIVGPAFLYGGEDYQHLLIKQTVKVSCVCTFDVEIIEGDSIAAVFNPFPLGAFTSTISSARVSKNGESLLIPLVIKKLSIEGGQPALLRGLDLNDGTGLTFPKIYKFQNYVFTYSAKYVIMLDENGNELIKDSISCVKHQGAEHTYIDRFDLLIEDGLGAYLIAKYHVS